MWTGCWAGDGPETDRQTDTHGGGEEGRAGTVRRPDGGRQGNATGAKYTSHCIQPTLEWQGFAPRGDRWVFNKYDTEVEIGFLFLLIFLTFSFFSLTLF